MKWRPCWCSKAVPWEFTSFLMQTLSFVPVNLHSLSHEWKPWGGGEGVGGSLIRQEAFIVITVNFLMAAISLFWNTNMAAVTSCENALVIRAWVHATSSPGLLGCYALLTPFYRIWQFGQLFSWLWRIRQGIWVNQKWLGWPETTGRIETIGMTQPRSQGSLLPVPTEGLVGEKPGNEVGMIWTTDSTGMTGMTGMNGMAEMTDTTAMTGIWGDQD